jgi:hypothetical protein
VSSGYLLLGAVFFRVLAAEIAESANCADIGSNVGDKGGVLVLELSKTNK